MSSDEQNSSPAARRIRTLKFHFLLYFALMIVLVPVNLFVTPDTPWLLWPMIGWGSLLAIHTAWAMGLFDILSPKD